jgi:glyoxylase I family protein
MAKIIGIDHIFITVSNIVQAEVFYDMLLRDLLQFQKSSFSLAGDPHIQYHNRHFGYVLRLAREQQTHNPYSPGLHHFCFRVESIEEVQELAQQLQALGIAATPAQCYPDYAPDYWATFFTDPDGIRLEVTNYRVERRERFAQLSA